MADPESTSTNPSVEPFFEHPKARSCFGIRYYGETAMKPAVALLTMRFTLDQILDENSFAASPKAFTHRSDMQEPMSYFIQRPAA